MRHQNTLFETFVQKEDKPKPDGYRPRNFMMPERDTALAYRYYYYVKIQRMQYADTLEKLCKEFFLSEYRLTIVLADNRKQLSDIMTEAPDVKTLSKLYDHIVWREKKD